MIRLDSVPQAQVPAVDSRDQKKLKQACQDFEAVFLGFLMKSMRNTVQKTDLFGSGEEEEIFQEMMDAQVCKSAAQTHTVGIADMLYKQLSPTVDQPDGADAGSMRGQPRTGGRGDKQ